MTTLTSCVTPKDSLDLTVLQFLQQDGYCEDCDTLQLEAVMSQGHGELIMLSDTSGPPVGLLLLAGGRDVTKHSQPHSL